MGGAYLVHAREGTALQAMTYQVIDRQDGTVLETWPTLKEAQQACDEICARWGEGEAFIKEA